MSKLPIFVFRLLFSMLILRTELLILEMISGIKLSWEHKHMDELWQPRDYGTIMAVLRFPSPDGTSYHS